jgi:hypothetical protein
MYGLTTLRLAMESLATSASVRSESISRVVCTVDALAGTESCSQRTRQDALEHTQREQ